MSNSVLGKPRWLIVLAFVGVGVFAVLGAAQYRDRWWPYEAFQSDAAAPNAVPGDSTRRKSPASSGEESARASLRPKVLELSPQARQNLQLDSRPVRLQSYWKPIVIPGEIVDRPGVSDRGVTSPAVGVVTQIHAFPGDTVRAGDRLFSLRLISEYIQNSQSELFRATRETQLIREQRERLAKAAEGGAIAQSRLIELDQQLRRFEAAIQGYRQDLLTRGLRPDQLQAIADGQFVSAIDIVAPAKLSRVSSAAEAMARETTDGDVGDATSAAYELQELRVDLGAQVQAGQLLGVLSDHRDLYIKGHAFKREAPRLEKAAQNGWPVRVEFSEDDPAHWPALSQSFEIRHLANSIDAASRTFDFFIPLTNQSRSYDKHGQSFVVWRFRPGQRVRLHVPVEELTNVIVVPASAVARDGPEAFVFRQNGDLFDRRPVQVLHEDRLNVVIASDGSIAPGWFIAQGSAAALNRVLKSQMAGGTPAGVHVHADGTVHGAH